MLKRVDSSIKDFLGMPGSLLMEKEDVLNEDGDIHLRKRFYSLFASSQ